MRILWHSVKPTIGSGYGMQSAVIIRELRRLDHEVAVSCTVGTIGTTENWEGIPCYPPSGQAAKYGADTVALHAKHFKADIVVSWVDAFVVPAAEAKKLNWLAWVPVDSDPLMVRNVEPLQACRWVAAPSVWGVGVLGKAGFDKSMLLPCAFNPKEFYPAEDAKAAKEQFANVINRPDAKDRFLVNVVSANAGDRKNFPALFEAWREFRKGREEEVLLYVHTDITGYHGNGRNLAEMLTAYGLDKADDIVFVSQWEYSTGQIGNDYLRLLHCASDVHLNVCVGEGFGLPIMEAQACGCPTITPKFGAAGEIGLNFQIKKGRVSNTVPGGLQFLVDPEDVSDQLDLAADVRGDQSIRRVTAELSAPWRLDRVSEEHLQPLLNRIENELH